MEEIARLVEADLEASPTFPTDSGGDEHQTVVVSKVRDNPAEVKLGSKNSDKLQEFFESDLTATACLRLVCVQKELDERDRPVMQIAKDVMLQLRQAIGMDPTALWLLAHDYDGFHHFPGDGDRSTSFMGSSTAVVVWTYDKRTLRTNVLFFIRIVMPDPEESRFTIFRQLLHQHKEYIASPALVPYMISMGLCRLYDSQLNAKEVRFLRSVERDTGFGSDATARPERHGIDQLSGWLRETGKNLMGLANKERHMRMVLSVLDHLDHVANPSLNLNTSLNPQNRDFIQTSTGEIIKAVPILRSRVRTMVEFMKYLKERSERLSVVLLALLTHEDAEANMDLAKANIDLAKANMNVAKATMELAKTSARIAGEVKRDSNAMKTVAMVTMFFLPATFLADVFSLPSVDWSGDRVVVLPNFWFFWAVAIPVTLLVFGIWAWDTKVRPVRSRAKAKRSEGTEAIDLSFGFNDAPQTELTVRG